MAEWGCALIHGSVRRNPFRVHGGTGLAGLCVNTAPAEVMQSCPPGLSLSERYRMENLYRRPHLIKSSGIRRRKAACEKA
jgi:hypothetical protein